MAKHAKPETVAVETVITPEVPETSEVAPVETVLVINVAQPMYDSGFIFQLKQALKERPEYTFGKSRFKVETVIGAFTAFVNRQASRYNKAVKEGKIIAAGTLSNYDAIRAICADRSTGEFTLVVDHVEVLKLASKLKNIIGFDGFISSEMAYDAVWILSRDIATRDNNDKFSLDDLMRVKHTAPQNVLESVLANTK